MEKKKTTQKIQPATRANRTETVRQRFPAGLVAGERPPPALGQRRIYDDETQLMGDSSRVQVYIPRGRTGTSWHDVTEGFDGYLAMLDISKTFRCPSFHMYEGILSTLYAFHQVLSPSRTLTR